MGLFDEYVRTAMHREELKQLSLAVQSAVEPFNPGDIFIGYETLVSTTVLHVSCKNWPSMDTRIDISRLDIVRYPEDSYLAVIRLVAEHFRNIPYTPPEGHHILGEN